MGILKISRFFIVNFNILDTDTVNLDLNCLKPQYYKVFIFRSFSLSRLLGFLFFLKLGDEAYRCFEQALKELSVR